MDVIKGAAEAVKIAGAVTGKSESEPLPNGRRYRHWSFYLLLSGAVMGAVATVALIITTAVTSLFLLIPAIIMAAALFVTDLIGAFYIRKFDRFKELGDYVQIMSDKIKELSGYVKNLEKINKELKGVRVDLEHNLEEDTKVWDEGVDKLKKERKEIEILSDKLEVSTKKLKKMEELYANLQNAVNLFSNKVVDLNENKNAIDGKVNELANKVTDAGKVLESFNNENEEFDENNVLYKELNNANVAFLQKFKEQLDKIFTMHYSAKELQETLERQGKALQKVSTEISASLDTISTLEAEEVRLTKESERILRKVGKAGKIIDDLKKATEPTPVIPPPKAHAAKKGSHGKRKK